MWRLLPICCPPFAPNSLRISLDGSSLVEQSIVLDSEYCIITSTSSETPMLLFMTLIQSAASRDMIIKEDFQTVSVTRKSAEIRSRNRLEVEYIVQTLSSCAWIPLNS